MCVSILALLADTVYFPDSILLEIIIELVFVQRQFVTNVFLNTLLNRAGHVISHVCLFFLSCITRDVDLSYLFH